MKKLTVIAIISVFLIFCSSIIHAQANFTTPRQFLNFYGHFSNPLVPPGGYRVSFSKEAGIILFGIPSLDALNRTYGVFDIISPSTYIPEGAYDRPYRRFIIKFPETTDLYQIQEDYEDDPSCIMAEFE